MIDFVFFLISILLFAFPFFVGVFCFPFFYISIVTLQEKQCQLLHNIKSQCEQWQGILQSMCFSLSLSLYIYIYIYIYLSLYMFPLFLWNNRAMVCNIMLLLKKYLLFCIFRNCFASASADNIKKFNLPKGEFCHNMLWVLCQLFFLCLLDNLLFSLLRY